MKTLEEILQEYFGFDDFVYYFASGKLTPKGSAAYAKLINLISDVGVLVDMSEQTNKIVDKLDAITNEIF